MDMFANAKKIVKSKKFIIAVVILAVLVTVVIRRPVKRRVGSIGPTSVVRRGPMTVAITASQSVVDAARKKIIRNNLRWDVIIQKVVPDGTRVKKGENIIQFQCAELEQQIEDADFAVDKARLDYDKAVKDLELQIKEMDNKVRIAEQELIKAQENFQRFNDKGGEREIEDSDAIGKINLAEMELSLAKDKLDFKLRINEDPELRKPYSESEIRADQLNVERLTRSKDKAVFDRKMLLKYEHPQKLRELNSKVLDAKLELERAKLIAANQLANSKADVKGKKTFLAKKEDKLKELKDDFKQLTVTANEPGLVVYDTAASRWRQSDVVVEVGAKISPRQQVMVIPDMSTLQVTAKVFEAVVNQIKPGKTPVKIRLDAKGDMLLQGTVKWVAPLPDKQNPWFSTGVQLFSIIIAFEKPVNEMKFLKPGMTAQVELVLAELDDVLSVPIAAIFTEQDKQYCRKVKRFGAEKVQVKIGKTNTARSQILEGLSEGDKVLLVPQDNEEQQGKDNKKTPGKNPGGVG